MPFAIFTLPPARRRVEGKRPTRIPPGRQTERQCSACRHAWQIWCSREEACTGMGAGREAEGEGIQLSSFHNTFTKPHAGDA